MFQNAKPVLLIICLGLIAIGCDKNPDPLGSRKRGSGTPPNLLVNVMRVKKETNASETSVFFGSLKPNRQSQLRFRQAGRLKSVLKNVGETLIAGERVAELEQEAEVLVAPYDCVIASQTAVVGDLVSPQSLIATVYETKPVFVEADLPLQIVQRLPINQLVWVAVGDEAVRAIVKTKSPLESTVGSRSVRFEVTAPISSSSWSFGQAVKIRFLTSTNKSGYWLPVSALSRESTGLWSALVVEPNQDQSTSTVQRKLVKLVQLEDDWALAEGGFKENEYVIVNGAHRVVPGQQVTPTDVTAQFAKRNTGSSE